MDVLINLLEQHGLGVALSAAIGCVAWYLLRYITCGHKEDRRIWKETLDAQQLLIMNHLSHLDRSNIEISQAVSQHDKNAERNSAAIVKAIESQTAVFKALYETPSRR